MNLETPFESRQQLIACLKEYSRHGNVVAAVCIVLSFGFVFGTAAFGARISALSPVLHPVPMVSVLFFVHIFINIGMTIGLMPITGLPLPFLSYGGSFILSCCIMQGFLQSIYRYRRNFS